MLMKMYVAWRAGSLPPSDLCCPSACLFVVVKVLLVFLAVFELLYRCCCCCMINSVLLLYRRHRRSRISFVLFALWFSLPEFTFSTVFFSARLFPRFRGPLLATHLYTFTAEGTNLLAPSAQTALYLPCSMDFSGSFWNGELK